MKKVRIYVPLLFLFISCSQKAVTKGQFKLVLGNTTSNISMDGGAYVELQDLSLNAKTIIKLDAENSAIIPRATYNMLFVTFAGPTPLQGEKYCGAVTNAALTAASATISVNITQAACSQSIYTALIEKLLSGENSKWDSAKFDQGKWSL